METTEIISFKNAIGQNINPEDWIAYPSGYKCHTLSVAKVSKIFNHNGRFLMIINVGATSWRGYSINSRRITCVRRVMKINENDIDFNLPQNRQAKILKALSDLEASL
jgi:hypothetical protein